MSLQFILGGAGSGKTRLLYEQVIREAMEHPQLQYLTVVPEQYTMQTQKELIRLHPRHGIMNIDVISFKRLAYRVFEDLGVKLPPILDDMGKSMVIRRVAGLNRSRLGLYSGHLEQAGFISQMKSQLSELYQYGLETEQLAQVAEETDRPLLKQKLQDLSVISRAFEEYIQSRFITSEQLLDILCRELPRWEPLKNSFIFLDGFTGFTPVQYRLAEILLEKSRGVVCSVTIGAGVNPYQEYGIQHLFHLSCHTVSRLNDMARRRHVLRQEDIFCQRRPAWRFRESPALDFMEQNLYRRSGRTWREETESVAVFRGRTPEDEVEYVCAQIAEAVRRQGLRYRDLAVITGDLASYGRVISHRFREKQIPFFLDDKKSILENPMVELIRAALETVKDFSYESVFRYLKTGLVYDEVYPRERAEQMTDYLENYVRALGIRGWKQWETPWERVCRGGERLNLSELNAYREWLVGPLRRLRQAFQADGAVIAGVTQALRIYLEEMGLREKLQEYGAFFQNRGEPGDENLAREYSQIFDKVSELLDRLEGLLGEEKADRRSFIQILDAGFQEIRVGVIPATVDQVMVGDITRSRLEAVKILFFVGVNEGSVPQRKSNTGLLTDAERELFKAHGLELAPTAREDGCIQIFYLYMILAKPERQLVLTYAAMTGDGKSQRPSSLLGEVKRLFPLLQEQETGAERRRVHTAGEGMALLANALREFREKEETETEGEQPQAALRELCGYFGSLADYRVRTRRLLEAAFYSYQEKGIGRAAARALYGSRLQGSVTRLEQFASCAYAHFLRYGLELMERQEYELEAVDMGNLFHQSIDLCFAIMKDRGQDWRSLTDEGRRSLVRDCVALVTAEYGGRIMVSSARNRYLAGRVERMTDRTIWALAEQVKKGEFTPDGFEVAFSAADHLRAMRIALSPEEELLLKGRIDRIDLCEDGGRLYVKIIDYKSGGTVFDLAALYYGLQLQLVVYMDAAIELEQRRFPGMEVLPAGLFYYHIQDPLAERQGVMTQEEIDRQILRQLRMNGLVNSELDIIRKLDREITKESDVIPVAFKDGYLQESRSSVASTKRFDALRQFVHRRLRQAGREILDGGAGVRPCRQGTRTACDYCPYHPVCGFDAKTEGYGFRRFGARKAEEIWEEIEREGGKEPWQ